MHALPTPLEMGFLSDRVYIQGICSVTAPIDGPSWAFSFTEMLPLINLRQQWEACSMDLRCPNLYSFTDTGIVTAGYMWTVDRPVDITPIQMKWKEHWETIAGFIANSDENITTKLLEINQTARAFADGKRLFSGSMSSLEHMAKKLLYDPTIRKSVSRALVFDFLDANPNVQQLTGRILFDLFRYLCDIGEKALANSIWHSIRTDCIYPDIPGRSFDLPDDVADVLANPDLSLDPWKALQLDRSDKTAAQSWLINRIMENGSIWVGHCTTPNPSRGLQDMDSGHDQADGNTQAPYEEIKQSSKPKFSSQSLIQKQATRNMLSMILQNGARDGEEDPCRVTIGSLAMFLLQLNCPIIELEAKVATFDVDGPCEIFTPYDSDMETFPRPAIRSYSVCSVVEPIIEDVGADTGEYGSENVAPAQCVDSKGKDRATDEDISDGGANTTKVLQVSGGDSQNRAAPETQRKRKKSQEDLQPNKEPRLDSGMKRKGKGREDVSRTQENTELGGNSPSSISISNKLPSPNSDTKFRVLGRVKGMWEYMEIPGIKYEFV